MKAAGSVIHVQVSETSSFHFPYFLIFYSRAVPKVGLHWTQPIVYINSKMKHTCFQRNGDRAIDIHAFKWRRDRSEDKKCAAFSSFPLAGDSLFIQGVIVESAGCSRALGLVLSYYLLTDPLPKWMFTIRYPE